MYERYISTHLGMGDLGALHRNERLWRRYYRLNYLPHLPEDKNARVLDIGCGMGHFLEFLIACGYKNGVGIDRSDEVVKYCSSRSLQVEKTDGLEHLAARPNTYDAIVMNDIVEHFTKSEIFDLISAGYEALRPNGAILVKTVNAANPVLGAHSLAIDFTHEWIFSEESLTQVLNVLDFRDVRVLPLNIYTNPWSPIHWAARAAAGCLNVLWRTLYTLYGRSRTRCFTKNILAVAKK
jgi:2-polyprenyl-3-methyl-5-hydroxy-6-metoxy-1,4-benzoquinol methylase